MVVVLIVYCADVREHSLFDPSTGWTGSSTSLEIAKRWIHHCKANHTQCQESSESNQWYPSRLIDVAPNAQHDVPRSGSTAGATTTDDPVTARLVVVSEQNNVLKPVEGNYITLSHCWGKIDFLKLTKSTLPTLQERILEYELPRTFQDTIYVCRLLGIRYIWIDSLCIIQDSKEDWQKEAALMHQVYANSYCNIAATGASDSSKGLFFNRRETGLFPVDVDMSWAGRPSAWYYILDLSYWQRHLTSPRKAPLNNRSWVVQERLLCPRVLHFGHDQLLWECRQMDASEEYPQGLPAVLQLDYFSGFKFTDAEFTGQKLARWRSSNLVPKFHPYEFWSRIVHTYSRCQLTNPGDKLIALSGIAKMMRERLDDEYVAGMWRRYLASQLSWYVDDCQQATGQLAIRPQAYRAPSFSWASLEAAVILPDYTDEDIIIEILEVKLCSTTDDDTGQLDSGFILIRGCLKKLSLERRPHFPPFPGAIVMMVNGKEVNEYQEPNAIKFAVPRVMMDLDTARYDYNRTNLYCMLLTDASSKPKESAAGLILEFLNVQMLGVTNPFRRVGSFRCSQANMEQIQAEDVNEGDLPCESYDETTKHTIAIV